MNENNRGKKSKRAKTSRQWLCDFSDDEGRESGHRDLVYDLPSSSSMGNRPATRHVSLDEIRALFAEQRDMLDLKLGELREEMNVSFNGIKKEIGDHVCCMKDHVTNQINMMKSRFKDVVTEIGGHKVTDKYAGIGCVNVGDEDMHVHDDYDDLSTLNIVYDEQHVEASDMDACNVDGSFGMSSDVVAPTVDPPNVNVPPPSRLDPSG